jgi:hypothetical protein
MHVTKRLDLGVLGKELVAASVAVNGLGLSGTDTDAEVFTYDADGVPIELPPEAVPVVEAHTAPPRISEYAGLVAKGGLLTTTGSSWVEVARVACVEGRVYRGALSMIGIDPATFATRSYEAHWLWKRAVGLGALVIAEQIIVNIGEAGTGSFDQRLVADGNDVVLQAHGAANQTVSWLGRLEVVGYALDGLAAAGGSVPEADGLEARLSGGL